MGRSSNAMLSRSWSGRCSKPFGTIQMSFGPRRWPPARSSGRTVPISVRTSSFGAVLRERDPCPTSCSLPRTRAEHALLRNLRSREPELTAFLEECSSHWGFEDPIYRFYHQSFKVYALQDQTSRIVRVLESLAPDRPLNPWFHQ